MIKSFGLVLAFFTLNSFAQNSPHKIIITLKAGQNIPTIEDVYNESGLSPPPVAYMLSSFNINPPMDVEYLVKVRAYGELKSLMENKPTWGKSLMERSLIITYSNQSNINELTAAFSADEYILQANIIKPSNLHAFNSNKTGTVDSDWHLQAVNWFQTPTKNSAFGHLGYIDIGAPTDRDEFEPFDLNTGNFNGGGLNLSQSFATRYADRNIYELREIDRNLVNNGHLCDANDSAPNDGFVYPSPKTPGHGSHVAGLMTAKSANHSGICQNCNISGTSEFTHYCDSTDSGFEVKTSYSLFHIASSLRYLVDSGRQSINMSLGEQQLADKCHISTPDIICTAISDAKARNIALVASAGNSRKVMNFPALDRDVIGVGGIQSNLQFWNLSPTKGNPLPLLDGTAQDTSNCPFAEDPDRNTQECGSNYSHIEIQSGNYVAERFRRIDVVAPALDVYSTLPAESEYNPFIGTTGCTDISDGVIDGYGTCTGTSMSAPIVTGIVQMIRAVNPLLPIGDDNPTLLDGIRDVLLFSGSEYQSTRQHNPWMGFGIPDAKLAVETVLGQSNGQLVKNRVTPLMVLHNDTFNDTIYTVFPQVALSYALNPSGFYQSATGEGIEPVNELDFYPVETVENERIVSTVPMSPFYVFTTKWNPLTQNDDLVPLYRLTKEVVSIPNCIPGKDDPTSCYVTERKTIMSTDEIEMATFHADGYELQGIEGYLIPCSDNNDCTIGGSLLKVYRVYDEQTDSYHLEQLFPPLGSTVLGAAFINWDGDDDGLTVGMEYLLGTNDAHNDSDGDGIPDGTEYPAAGVPYSDPMINDIIFISGFDQ